MGAGNTKKFSESDFSMILFPNHHSMVWKVIISKIYHRLTT